MCANPFSCQTQLKLGQVRLELSWGCDNTLLLIKLNILQTIPSQPNQTKPNHIDGWLTPSSSQNVQVHHRIIPTSIQQCNICLNLILSLCGGSTAYMVRFHSLYCANPFSCKTQLKLGQFELRLKLSWGCDNTILMIYNDLGYPTKKTIPTKPNQTKPNQTRLGGLCLHLNLKLQSSTKKLRLLRFIHSNAV